MTTPLEVGSRDEAKSWIIKNQLGRRNLPPAERAALALRMKPLIAEQAKQRQATSTGGAKPQLSANWPKADQVDTRKELAKAAGVGERTMARVEKVMESGVPELQESMRRGEVSVDAAFRVATLPAEDQLKAVQGGREGVKRAAKVANLSGPTIDKIEQIKTRGRQWWLTGLSRLQ